MVSSLSLFISLVLLSLAKGIQGATFTVVNRCQSTIWPGILANAGSQPLDSTGFELPSGGTRTFQAPPSWSGRFWGRTGCQFDPSTNQGTCLTGDCGSNQIECNGQNAKPPATLAEFTVAPAGGQDYYDVSLVDGYNLPIVVEPMGGSGGTCSSTGCVTDLNRRCPSELRVGSGAACNSACEAFGTPEYCCSGEFGSPDTCKPSRYSEMFKSACPRAYSYAYDDASSTFTCSGADYMITFCPSSTSQKSANVGPLSISATTGSDNGPTESGDGPLGINTSWLPNFVTGSSSSPIPSSSSWTWPFMIASAYLLFSSF
ncbi:unnamed protein product [Linum tenue]|uniref:Thaumatin-like protein 1b n=1 Tax=Linum tenue TaxID=586396 RepID=A0AAV0LNT1_9ROSI|nr:unnamed protein product [Linum tenue]